MIDETRKKRVMITLPKRQLLWIQDFCKIHKITISHYISWMIAKKAEEMIKILRIDNKNYTEEEYEDILEIIRTKWVDY